MSFAKDAIVEVTMRRGVAEARIVRKAPPLDADGKPMKVAKSKWVDTDMIARVARGEVVRMRQEWASKSYVLGWCDPPPPAIHTLPEQPTEEAPGDQSDSTDPEAGGS